MNLMKGQTMKTIFPVAIIAIWAASPMLATELCKYTDDTQVYDSQSICVTSALAPQGKNNYDIKALTDGNPSTAWCEGVKGRGIGEIITLRWTNASAVDNIWLNNGYTKSNASYTNNGRLRDVRLTLWPLDGLERRQMSFTLRDTPAEQAIPIPWPNLRPRQIEIEILSTYEGAKYRDTCLSEIWPDFGL
ncbi:MAG: hypothetical protein Q9M48_12005 [Rhodobacterales bacterium]|nr:hypothetical protein [Rhodobacterales bacterium]